MRARRRTRSPHAGRHQQPGPQTPPPALQAHHAPDTAPSRGVPRMASTCSRSPQPTPRDRMISAPCRGLCAAGWQQGRKWGAIQRLKQTPRRTTYLGPCGVCLWGTCLPGDPQRGPRPVVMDSDLVDDQANEFLRLGAGQLCTRRPRRPERARARPSHPRPRPREASRREPGAHDAVAAVSPAIGALSRWPGLRPVSREARAAPHR